ncbi:hypothetical protein J2R95_008740 [Bradyrhizobium japonicum]|uniref:hypothetical protein n=1 Tax=Bradyrhizobium japonicum TaxID=375 RepID=UPI00209FEAD3|nr:hypothetical protein [Bradyrhizobium japonicum]MCP1792441.1 hypothetical protein [Bradyrhizobium japonicum]MCP1804586.1 hypothetical protein [Bradyrhizobium japonicum]MCP1878811.1 hypothetical protein [Bradyrhizobium japonicum]MCP1942945.1 hypothetical protein [Bradyrhizobium japonicum]MCP1946230.1 hypothetical protein [Bradyrhizobium japonicum]
MAPLKTKTTDEFRVPSLAEADSSYADLIAKRVELEQRDSKLNSERSKLRGKIEAGRAAFGKHISPGVAALLGDDPTDSIADLSRQLREVTTEIANIESAREVLHRRTDEARNVASKLVCFTMMPEYQRRLGAVCEAARALEAAKPEKSTTRCWTIWSARMCASVICGQCARTSWAIGAKAALFTF